MIFFEFCENITGILRESALDLQIFLDNINILIMWIFAIHKHVDSIFAYIL